MHTMYQRFGYSVFHNKLNSTELIKAETSWQQITQKASVITIGENN